MPPCRNQKSEVRSQKSEGSKAPTLSREFPSRQRRRTLNPRATSFFSQTATNTKPEIEFLLVANGDYENEPIRARGPNRRTPSLPLGFLPLIPPSLPTSIPKALWP